MYSEIKTPEDSKIPPAADERFLKCMKAQQFQNDFCAQLLFCFVWIDRVLR